jgi:hypothetical protein
LTVCKPLRQIAIRDYRVPPEKVEVLYNGIATDPFDGLDSNARHQARAKLKLAEDMPVIGVFGRLFFAEKGQNALIGALPKILERCPGTKLLIVGDGPDRLECERLCGVLKVAHAVLFTGQRNDIAALMAAVDVVVVPSVCEEATPYVVLEALCAGRAVVASNVGGMGEIVVEGETGLLVPKGDVTALAEAVVCLLTDRRFRERLAAAGRQHARNFTIERHVQRLTEIYRTVCAPNGTENRRQRSPGSESVVRWQASRYPTTRHAIITIFVAGIDGSGKTAALELLISRLERNYRILRNHDGMYLYYRGEKKQALKYSWFKAACWLKRIAPARLRGLFSLLTFTARHLEEEYVKRHAGVDLVVYETDTVLHPAAFAAFHFPWLKVFKSNLRFKILHWLFGRRKNSVTFYLDTDSGTAMERIRTRNTAADAHENFADLERLKGEFEDLVRAANDHNVRIVRIDTNNRTVGAVVSEMEAVLRDRLAIACDPARVSLLRAGIV